MTVRRYLNELYRELRLIDEAIAVFERIAGSGQTPSGRLPKWPAKGKLARRRQGQAQPPIVTPQFRGIVESLRLRFEEAAAAYKQAAQEYHRLMNIVKDLEAASPDGHRALMQAMQIQQQALLKYERASKELWEFTARGKLPSNSETDV